MIQIAEGPRGEALARDRAEKLIDYAIEIFDAAETEPGNRKSEYTPPIYNRSFAVRKRGRRLRVVNRDGGTNFVEWGAHPGNGPTFALGYAPMRKALDRLGNETD
ncbi:hypothetical protein ACFP2T_35730 [Plantactinospora solaniradicis]|uniref:HK97 gp10 family phage protein n=2 Tax=Plantactinospora solaniradicis TaxID=1723736 RepID=A0ABW1KK68_9ACTN